MTLHYNQNPSGWNGFATLADFYGKFDASDIRRGIPAGSVPGLPFAAAGANPIPDANKFSGIGLGFLTGQQKNDDGTNIVDNRTGLPLQFTPEVPLSGAGTAKGYRIMKYSPSLL